MDKEKFYITTTLPYVNAKPHMGHAQEFVYADVIARYHRDVLNEDVIFNTGTDEHGQKIYEKALEEKKDPQAYADEYAAKFDGLKQALNLSYNHFIRTTSPQHIFAAQEFWDLCSKNGDIYKKDYKIKYCVGCELEKTESDLDENGRCLIHPNLEIEIIEEENYFFRFSKYEKPLLDFYEANPSFVVPDFRFNEIKQFVKNGLQDFSISRLAKKMPWGVPVPGNDEHVMYVWFDALINYISTLGWPGKLKEYNEFWPGIQIAGKDNIRQQAAMWQAMLMSAGLPNSKQIIIHGFINSGGQKMSKSLGNVIDPLEIVEKYGTDALRYWLCREVSTFEDGDFTWERFKESYNSGLANGLGNLVSRILKMAVNAGITNYELRIKNLELSDPVLENLNKYNLKIAIDNVWLGIKYLDSIIQKSEPFKKIKTNVEEAKEDITSLMLGLEKLAVSLEPFLPETSEKISEALKNPKEENIPRLFPRIE